MEGDLALSFYIKRKFLHNYFLVQFVLDLYLTSYLCNIFVVVVVVMENKISMLGSVFPGMF